MNFLKIILLSTVLAYPCQFFSVPGPFLYNPRPLTEKEREHAIKMKAIQIRAQMEAAALMRQDHAAPLSASQKKQIQDEAELIKALHQTLMHF